MIHGIYRLVIPGSVFTTLIFYGGGFYERDVDIRVSLRLCDVRNVAATSHLFSVQIRVDGQIGFSLLTVKPSYLTYCFPLWACLQQIDAIGQQSNPITKANRTERHNFSPLQNPDNGGVMLQMFSSKINRFDLLLLK